MRWGVRKDQYGATRRTRMLAKKDAKRYADAKMFYGKGAGTRRKLLKAELEKRKKTISGYKFHFDKAVKDVDFAKSAKKAKIERTYKDTKYRTRVTIKQFLGITGPLTVAAGTALYYANRPAVDAFVKNQYNRVITQIQFRDIMRKGGFG